MFFTRCLHCVWQTEYGKGRSGSSAVAGRAVTPVWSVLALPGEVRSGSLRSLVLLNCLSEYLTFSFRRKASRAPAQACSLTTLTVHWDTWMALHFTPYPPYTYSLRFSLSFLLLVCCFKKYIPVKYLSLLVQFIHSGLYLSLYPSW